MARKAWSSFLLRGGGISTKALIFCGSGCIPLLNITSPKNGTEVHLKWHFSLFNFCFTSLHHCSTLWTVSLWSLPSASYPPTKISSAMPNTFGMSLKISSFFSLEHITCWSCTKLQSLLSVSTKLACECC